MVYIKGDDEYLVQSELHRALLEIALDGHEESPSQVVSAISQARISEVLADYCELEQFVCGKDEIGAIVSAGSTPAFLAPKRIVVATQVGALSSSQTGPLVDLIGDPVESTYLVLVSGGGRLAPALERAVKTPGVTQIDASSPTGAKGRQAWLDGRLARRSIKMDADAKQLLLDHVGDDVERVDGILSAIVASQSNKAKIDLATLVPVLGNAGDVPPWDLTDAIDSGDTRRSLNMLTRMTCAGGRSPGAILGIIHRHFRDMFLLDGANANTDARACEILGISSTFRASKLRRRSDKLGTEKLARAMVLLHEADLDVKGRRDWPENLTLEVLVARLSRLGAQGVQRR